MPMQHQARPGAACADLSASVCHAAFAAGGEATSRFPRLPHSKGETERPLTADTFSFWGDATAASQTLTATACTGSSSLHTAPASRNPWNPGSSLDAARRSAIYNRPPASPDEHGGCAGNPVHAREDDQEAASVAEGDVHAQAKRTCSGTDDEHKQESQQRQLYKIQAEEPDTLQQEQVAYVRQESELRRSVIPLTIEIWLFTLVAAAIDWGLMLICMTFNAGLFLVIMGGIATGRALTSASLASSLSSRPWLQQHEQHG